MRRFFFSFVLIFIGFGAFGQSDNTQHNSKQKKMEEWYILSFDDSYIGLNLNWSHMKLQDQLYAPFVYSGHGFMSSLSIGGTHKKIHAEGYAEWQLVYMRPSNRDQRELLQNFTGKNGQWFNSLGAPAINLAHRIGTSPHYAGLNFSWKLENFYFSSDDKTLYIFFPASFRLFHLYHGKIRNTRFRTTTMLPILTILEKNVKRVFNPTIKLELFPGFLYKDGFLHSTSVVYKLDYFNYTYRDFNYRHRRIAHSVGVAYYFGLSESKID